MKSFNKLTPFLEKIMNKELTVQNAQELCFLDLCQILSEICGGDYKHYARKFRNCGYNAVFGTIIVEIRRRKYEGDKLRHMNKELAIRVSELSQLSLFPNMKPIS